MTTELKPAVLEMKDQIEEIKTPEIKNFVVNALSMAPESFYQDQELLSHTKKTYAVLMGLLGEEAGAPGLADAFRAAVLLQDLCHNETGDQYRRIHPIMVRTLLQPIRKDLSGPIFDTILGMVEGHEADESPSPLLEPKPTNTAFLLAFANKFVRLSCVQVNV